MATKIKIASGIKTMWTAQTTESCDGQHYSRLAKESKYTGCFVAGTLVHTDKGLVPIDKLKVGDLVLSRPENVPNAPNEYKRVLRTFKSAEKKRVMAIMYSNIDPEISPQIKPQNCSVIYLTEDHPIWVNKIGNEASETLADEQNVDFIDPNIQLGWTLAKDLRNGMIIELQNGAKGEVIDVYNQLFAGSIDELYWEGLEASWDCNPERLIDFRSGSRKTYHISGHVEGLYSNYGAIYGAIASDNPDEFVAVQDFMSSYGEDGRPHGYNSTIAELFVYNIEVEDFHTYYVDHFGVWVHNTNKCFNEQA